MTCYRVYLDSWHQGQVIVEPTSIGMWTQQKVDNLFLSFAFEYVHACSLCIDIHNHWSLIYPLMIVAWTWDLGTRCCWLLRISLSYTHIHVLLFFVLLLCAYMSKLIRFRLALRICNWKTLGIYVHVKDESYILLDVGNCSHEPFEIWLLIRWVNFLMFLRI